LNRRAQAFPGCGLDVHGFRALAERSLFADQIKDRAVASVSPEMAGEWLERREALRGWKNFSRADLQAFKQRFGVEWVMLERVSPPHSDGLNCPYQNQQVRICRVD